MTEKHEKFPMGQRVKVCKLVCETSCLVTLRQMPFLMVNRMHIQTKCNNVSKCKDGSSDINVQTLLTSLLSVLFPKLITFAFQLTFI